MGNKQSVKSHMENAQRTGVFQLSNAKLAEIPPELFRLKSLRSIDLSSNKLKEIPPTFGMFTNLRTLMLNANQLTKLPEEIGQLSKLETISLSGNLLESIPSSFINLRSLRRVELSNNCIKKFPTNELANLRQLDFLDLSNNKIGIIPSGVDSIYASEINLNGNQLTKIDDDLARCPRLKVLRMEENCLQLNEITRKLLADSNISLLAVDGNLFQMKQLHDEPDYEKYMERYTATKKKL
ncbi:Leucine-rich repeat-containing protein 57 [Blomia tropicalis]|nr:Leucine-rich repeat-containing protein 57 [Blomia tropicalis]